MNNIRVKEGEIVRHNNFCVSIVIVNLDLDELSNTQKLDSILKIMYVFALAIQFHWYLFSFIFFFVVAFSIVFFCIGDSKIEIT